MTDLTIRPFEVHVPDEDLADLQRRIAATRWPPKELVADRSQGVQLATIHDLMTYWSTGGCSTTTPTATTRSPRVSRRPARGQSHPGPHPRQRHAVLADRHRGLGSPLVLGGPGRPQLTPAGQAPPRATLPVGFTTFPGGIFRAPRSWVEKLYPHVIYFNQAARAATSRPGKSRNCSPPKSGRRLDRCASRRHRRGPGGGYLRPASANTRQVL